MKILYITQTLPPEPGATLRPLRQAQLLAELGHKVSIVATMPYFPEGRIHRDYRGKLWQRELLEGIEVLRVWSLPAANRGIGRRLGSYGSFALAASLAARLLPRPDLVIASVPHLGTELAGVLVSESFGCPALLELRDLLPDSLAFIGVTPSDRLWQLLTRYMEQIYRRYALISAPSETMAAVLVERGVAPGKLLRLSHGADFEAAPPAPRDPSELRRQLGLDERVLVLYSGSFNSYYDVPNMVRAMALVPAHEAQLVALGTGSELELARSLVHELELPHVQLPGVMSQHAVRDYLEAADLTIASTVGENTPASYYHYLNTKAVDYLAAGRPVLAVEDGALVGPIIEAIGAGQRVAAREPEQLAAAIRDWADHPQRMRAAGEAASRYAREALDRRRLVAQFEAELKARLVLRTTEPRRPAPLAALGRWLGLSH